jgi:hypothetical protein
MHVFENFERDLEEGEQFISCEASFGRLDMLAQVLTTHETRHQPLEASAFEWAAEEPAFAVHVQCISLGKCPVRYAATMTSHTFHAHAIFVPKPVRRQLGRRT